jgi:threonine/homoserine/homoserine lactone efflux protein
MLHAFGSLLPYALPVALSPLPVIALVMLLLSAGGGRGGLAFTGGRMAALALVTFAVALVADRFADPTEISAKNGWLRIVLGMLIVTGAVAVWRRRPRQGEEARLPGWMRSIEGLGTGGALRIGVVITLANIKELAFAAGAGVLIGTDALSTRQTATLSVLFAAMAAGSAAALVAFALAAPATSRTALSGLRDWMARYNSAVMAVVLLAIGTMLIGKGLEVL